MTLSSKQICNNEYCINKFEFHHLNYISNIYDIFEKLNTYDIYEI